MSEENKSSQPQNTEEEEKIEEQNQKKSNVSKDNPNGYPELPPKKRKDGQEVVPWTQNPTSDFVNPYGLVLKRKKRKKSPEYDKPR